MSKSIIFVLTLLSALFLFSACGGPEDYKLYNTEAYLTQSAASSGMCTEDCSGMACPDGYSPSNQSGAACHIDDDDGACKGRYQCKCVNEIGSSTGKAVKYSCDTGAPIKGRRRASVEQTAERSAINPGAL